jgi:hypothetical protein
MTEWSLGVTIPAPPSAVADDAAAVLAEGLSEHAPAISASQHELSIRIAVTGEDVGEATTRGLHLICTVLRATGWPTEVRALDVAEWSAFEGSLDEPTYPELVGVTEIAQLLGTSRQRASELARSPRFPVPLADLAAGPVWPKGAIARFVDEWDRKPGRPKSKTAQRLAQIVEDRRAHEVEGMHER